MRTEGGAELPRTDRVCAGGADVVLAPPAPQAPFRLRLEFTSANARHHPSCCCAARCVTRSRSVAVSQARAVLTLLLSGCCRVRRHGIQAQERVAGCGELRLGHRAAHRRGLPHRRGSAAPDPGPLRAGRAETRPAPRRHARGAAAAWQRALHSRSGPSPDRGGS
jgi:hypothetical protein